MTKFPLRTKRKTATREKLVRSARHLFLTKGYDKTTLEEIAELAGLHVQTLYRHFPTKQDLAKAGDERYLRVFEASIKDRHPSQTTFQFWREHTQQTLEEITSEQDLYRSHLKMRESSPTIIGATEGIQQRYEDILTEHLAKDFGLPADGVNPARLAACSLLSANRHVSRIYAEDETQSSDELKANAMAVIDLCESTYSKFLNS